MTHSKLSALAPESMTLYNLVLRGATHKSQHGDQYMHVVPRSRHSNHVSPTESRQSLLQILDSALEIMDSAVDRGLFGEEPSSFGAPAGSSLTSSSSSRRCTRRSRHMGEQEGDSQ
ncbi:hypothetical protein ACA910_004559 [Epithemia clementina (nom. ined.)]